MIRATIAWAALILCLITVMSIATERLTLYREGDRC